MEVLLRKHEAFEKTVLAQMGKIEELEKFGTELLAAHHYDSAAITQRLQVNTGQPTTLMTNKMSSIKLLTKKWTNEDSSPGLN